MFNNECSLREVLEAIEKNNIYANFPCTREQLESYLLYLTRNKSIIESSICFDVGDIRNIENITADFNLFKLPYPSTWFNFNCIGTNKNLLKYGVHAYCNSNNEVGFTIFRKFKNNWIISGRSYYKYGDKGYSSNGYSDSEIRICAYAIGFISKFLSALNCINTNIVIHTPPESIQKQRAKHGKKPLFSYYTLHVDLPKTQSNPNELGGTHSSPRVHLRRGHPRQYSQDKWTWVQPCVVGSKENGMIHKDYAFDYMPA